MKRKLIISLMTAALAVTVLAGCGASSSPSSKYAETSTGAYSSDYAAYEEAAEEYMSDYGTELMETGSTAEAGEVGESAAESKKNDSRKLIRTITLSAETYEFDDLTAQIKAKTEGLGGYIERSNVYGDADEGNRYASFTLRIPAENADSLVETIEGKSNITESSEGVEDVTLTYVDIASRKESLQMEYDRLEELLKNAENIEELIYIEERLADVRYEIQSIESQLRTYDNKVNYTTINLTIDEVREYTPVEVVNPTYGQRLARELSEAFKNIWEGLQDFSIFIIVAIPYLVILAIPVVLVILIVRLVNKKTEKKRQARREAKAADAAARVAAANARKAEAAAGGNNALDKAEVASQTDEDRAEADEEDNTIPYSDRMNK